MKVQASAPGKLYIAGEYAVVEAGHPALIAAIASYLTVTLEQAGVGTIYSTQQDKTVNWKRDGELFCLAAENPYELIVSAVRTAEEYARIKGCSTRDTYSIWVESQLDHQQSGLKYGLGSSGAVTVATVRAVLAFYGLEETAYLVYQLSAVAQLRLGMKGSFGDVVASSFGGVVVYHSLDRTWLRERLAHASLAQILEQPWPCVKIEPVELPAELSLLIGWTGQVALTDERIETTTSKRTQAEKALFYQRFLEENSQCVAQLVQACHQQRQHDFQDGIRRCRQLLQVFANEMEMLIETPILTKLCHIAQEEGATAKSSGAGGGDCGICFAVTKEQEIAIYQKWQNEGILPLRFSIADRYQ